MQTHFLLVTVILWGLGNWMLPAQPYAAARIDPATVRLPEPVRVYVDLRGFDPMPRPEFPPVAGMTLGRLQLQRNRLPQGLTYTYVQEYLPRDTGQFIVPPIPLVGAPDRTLATMSGVVLPPLQGDYRDALTDLRFEIRLEPETAYVGQAVRLRVELWVPADKPQALRVSDRNRAELAEQLRNLPFWEERGPTRASPKTVSEGDRSYRVETLVASQLFPLEAGEFSFENLALQAERREEKANSDGLDVLTGRDHRYLPVTLYAGAQTLTVLPLPPTPRPGPAPAGRFTWQVELSEKSTETGRPLYLRVRVRGTGNPALTPAPYFDSLEYFAYGPLQTATRVFDGDSLLGGEKTFTYELIPAQPGDFTIGPFRFFYFDPQTQRFDSLKSPSIKLAVSGEAQPELLEGPMGSFYERALSEASDRPPLRLFSGPWLWIVLLVASLGVGTFALLRERAKR